MSNTRNIRLVLFSLMLTLALALSACGNQEADTGNEVVVGEEVVEEDTPVVEEEADVEAEADAEAEVDAEADVEADAEAAIDAEEADVVATEVVTETLTDTDVMTETIVTTESAEAEVVAETIVMTDTDVSVDTETDTETETEVEVEDVSEETTVAIMILTDADGNELLGDPVEQQPFFATDEEADLLDERFEPVEFNEEALYDENLDPNLFGEVEQNGVRQLTYNGYLLYHFVGEEGDDWMAAASEAGLSPLTPAGELWVIE